MTEKLDPADMPNVQDVPNVQDAPVLPDVHLGVVAIGWATVESDRAAGDLVRLLADGERFEEASESPTLGARCRMARAGDAHRGLLVVLLEPITEGRLAAFLARYGEGWAAAWVDAMSVAVGPGDVGTARAGPLGLERLMAGAPANGPFRLLVETATIGP